MQNQMLVCDMWKIHDFYETIILSSPAIWNFKLFNHEVNGILLNTT